MNLIGQVGMKTPKRFDCLLTIGGILLGLFFVTPPQGRAANELSTIEVRVG